MPITPELGSNGGKRLDSWKEIAAYLKRDRRTVQRWEANEGLPVHRHVHESQATVYAYASELDAWQASRRISPSEESTPAVESTPGAPPPRRRVLALSGIALLAVLAVAILAGYHFGRDLAFQEHDWILVAAFENLSGESVLDGALRNALERELSTSRFVNVVPRERVEDALRLMRKPLTEKLDVALAQEVCLRDGGIRALITGKTEKLGSAYVFSVDLIDPSRSRTIASSSETATGPDGIAPAIRRLSNWVRASLGEAMSQIETSNRELEKVTTPSLRAWQLFTEANDASRNGQWALSAELNRQAVAEDPDFASAHLWLAWALRNLRDEGWRAEARLALDLSNTVGERERLFIVASNYLMNDQNEQAIPVFEALIRMHPDFSWGYPNLASAYRAIGRPEGAAEVMARVADLRPNDYRSHARAGVDLLPFDLNKASHYTQRARELLDLQSTTMLDIKVRFSRFHELWAQDDVRGAWDELRRLERLPVSREVAAFMGLGYLTLGRIREAREWEKKDDVDSPAHARRVFEFAMFTGDQAETRKALEAFVRRKDVSLDARAALICGIFESADCAGGMAAAIRAYGPLPFMTGALALQQGRNADAIFLFQQSYDKRLREDGTPYAGSAEGLSTAYERTGKLPEAAESLERVSSTRLNDLPMSGLQWLNNQARLASLYRKLGRDSDARRIEGQLLKLLSVADPDFALLRELRSR